MFKILPNHLTLSRVGLALLYSLCLSFQNAPAFAAAALLAAAAFISDMLDGYLARKNNIVSAFGICFDPVADKIFNLCAFASLMHLDRLSLSVFPFLLIIIREVGISGVRVVLLSSDQVLLPAERFGKIKATFQFALIFIWTLGLWLESAGLPGASWILEPPRPSMAFWMVALYTFASSWAHLWKHRKALMAAWQGRGGGA